ncbi:Retrovirus-related Pol polyprotein from transposon TNT 1-94 [Bienertia sinuspersici]
MKKLKRKGFWWIERTTEKIALNAEKELSVPTSVRNVKRLSKETLWHQRMGHAPMAKVSKVMGIPNTKQGSEEVYLTCPIAKFTKLPFNVSKSRASEPFELVHIDTWGPYRVQARNEHSYFLTVGDDHTRVHGII